MCLWFSVLKCAHDSAWWRKTNEIRCRFIPPSCHSARRACPELQNPLPQFLENNLLPGEKMRLRTDEGWGKCYSPALSHHLRRSPLSQRARVIFLDDGFCDFAFGFAQNDREGGMLWRVKVLWLEKPTKREPGIMCIDFLMMLCALVRNDAECIG